MGRNRGIQKFSWKISPEVYEHEVNLIQTHLSRKNHLVLIFSVDFCCFSRMPKRMGASGISLLTVCFFEPPHLSRYFFLLFSIFARFLCLCVHECCVGREVKIFDDVSFSIPFLIATQLYHKVGGRYFDIFEKLSTSTRKIHQNEAPTTHHYQGIGRWIMIRQGDYISLYANVKFKILQDHWALLKFETLAFFQSPDTLIITKSHLERWSH